jgi:hypothetical protein
LIVIEPNIKRLLKIQFQRYRGRYLSLQLNYASSLVSIKWGPANALAVLAAGDKGSFLRAPDMYMEKLFVGPEANGSIDLNLL